MRDRYTRTAVSHPIITIEDPSQGPQTRPPAASWLQGRRLAIAGGLAAAEVIVYLLQRPNRWFAILLVGAILAGCIALSGKVKSGTARDLILIVGLAQALVIALPILVGVFTLVIATLTVLALIAVFVVIGLRFRR